MLPGIGAAEQPVQSPWRLSLHVQSIRYGRQVAIINNELVVCYISYKLSDVRQMGRQIDKRQRMDE